MSGQRVLRGKLIDPESDRGGRLEERVGTAAELRREIARGVKRRELQVIGDFREIGPGVYHVWLRRHRRAVPRWLAPVTAVALTLAGLCAAGRWLVGAMSAPDVAWESVAGGVAVGLLALAALRSVARGKSHGTWYTS